MMEIRRREPIRPQQLARRESRRKVVGRMSQGRSMNAERETETLNRARQLVFGTETLAPTHGSLIGFGGGQPMSSGGGGGFYNRDQCLNLRPVYPRLPTMLPQSLQHQPPPLPPLQPYLYTSNSHHFPNPTTQQYPPPPPHMNADYLVGHVFSGNNNNCSHHRPPSSLNYPTELNYTCIGGAPPLAHGFPTEGVHGTVTGDVNRGNRTDGLSRDGSDSSSMHPLGKESELNGRICGSFSMDTFEIEGVLSQV
ncbi:hypothetical protein QJS10_CPA01g01461 [Acorus calamus]|uniref:Uncharacterized protein n=1 Tax=Acorus calamus TaxID=4465 RepID=A0AAV9FFI7_ACOCL|nr:hypothetical protein QJS10_CPA01g01461 [Acorus calamus]